MAQLELHNVKDNWYAVLNGAINNAVTSLLVDGAGAGGEPTVPFYFDIDSEQLECTAVAVDTPSAGISTLTVVRARNGTSAASHSDNANVYQNAYAAQITELQADLAALKYLIARMMGGGEGIQETATGTDLKVQAQGTPGMTVKTNTGAGIVSGEPIALRTVTNSATMVAPVTNPRIDIIQISQEGTPSIKAGSENVSPSAPTVDALNLKLCEIYHRVGETSIKNTDDATNGYITDSRVFL